MKTIITTLILSLLLLAVGGCAALDKPAPLPVITDIRESVVKVSAAQSGGGFAGNWPSEAAIYREAQAGCQRYNRDATPISWHCKLRSESIYRGCEVKEYLFACDTP